MSKSSTVVAAVLGGMVAGLVLALVLSGNMGTFCPVCGGRIGSKRGFVVCARCGAKLRLEEHPSPER